MRTSATLLAKCFNRENNQCKEVILISVKFQIMFLQKNSQNIDRLIEKIQLIKMDRCSLSAEDCSLLDEVIVVLIQHKQKWKKGDAATLLVILKLVELLSKVFY